MTSRERFRRIIDFQQPDRISLMQVEDYERETIERWRREGLPEGVSPAQHFGMDVSEFVPVSYFIHPRYEREVLEEDEQYRVVRNWQGIIVKESKEKPDYIFAYQEHPVKTRDDWERMKERLDPRDPGRYPEDWGPDTISAFNSTDNPVGLLVYPLFFRRGLYFLGMERFLTEFYDDPDLIHDMFSFSADFALTLTRDIMEKVHVDFVAIAEDMAFKHSTHVSPAMWNEFWVPHIGPLMDFLKSSGVKCVSMWSSGNIRPLMPQFLEAGFNCFWPLEVNAGVNALELREEFGKDVLLFGNISNQALIAGKDAIKREVMEKVPPLVEQGGYIPAVDEIVPPEVSFQNYAYYVELIRSLG